MAELTQYDLEQFLLGCQGKIVDLSYLRKELSLIPNGKSWHGIRKMMQRLAEDKVVSPTGRRDGTYKVITQVRPVVVFSKERERRPPLELFFPRDFDTEMEMFFARDIVVREGDLINISGVSNYGKTTLAINFCAENIDRYPVLMGNEYTTIDCEPTPRFLNRLDSMDWIQWANGVGQDKFTLLPVRDDYAEHIVKDRINIIDWINIDANELYDISKVMENIKKNLGTGVAIVVLQKGEGATAGRGGQFTKDFSDCELLIDKLSDHEVLLTVGKVKEYLRPVTGRTFAYSISKGVKILNFREVKRCPSCKGQGYIRGERCETCEGKKYTDKADEFEIPF